MDDDDLSEGINDWFDYCKRMFRKVTKNDLIEFENKYKGKKQKKRKEKREKTSSCLGSDEEKRDLKRIYLEATGDMDQIFERHLLTCLEDEDRLRSMIDEMIENKDFKLSGNVGCSLINALKGLFTGLIEKEVKKAFKDAIDGATCMSCKQDSECGFGTTCKDEICTDGKACLPMVMGFEG